MKKRPMAKLLAWLLASALVLPMLPVFSLKALAAGNTYYIDYGNITVSKNAGDASLLDVTYYAFSGASSPTTDTVTAADELVIAQTNGSTGSVIAVASGEVHMTLDRVNIYNRFSTSFTISPGATVHLTLSGACSLDAGGATAYICGMYVPSGAAVVIDKKTSDSSDSLYARSGSSCAGIGGGNGQSCGSMTINGGTLNVISANSGAGIGGGTYGSGGSVTINGGTVNATSGGGAGIGGGYGGSGGTVTINGGTVTAKSTNGGAGIGGGYNGSGGSVTITGGTVIATGSPDMMSGKYPASIGGGANAATHGTLVIDIPEPDAVIDSGYGGSITGSGPYTVTASSGYVIDSLKVDGVEVSDATGQESYEIISVSKSLVVTFAYTANFLEPANGSLTVSSAGETITSEQIVRGGQQLSITANPDTGYVLESLTVNGEDVTDEYDEGYTYTVGTRGNYRTLAADMDTGTQGAQIAASFTQANTLISITQPAAITGVPNSTAKTAFALGLPAAVGMIATEGSVQAGVLWDVASSAYDPGNTAAQTFAVNGTVTLPDGIINPNSVALTAGISVSVDAALTVPVVWQSAAADGAADLVTSTRIDLIFDTAIAGLTSEDITNTDGTGSAVKGALTGSGTSWSIALDHVTAQGAVSVAISAPAGYILSGSPKTVAVYKAVAPTPVTWQTAAADGTVDTVTSSKIDLTFDTPVTELTANDIIITNGIGAVVKGALTGGGTSWSIALDDVTAQGAVSVAISAPAGYILSGSPKTVVVYKAAQPSGTAPVITTEALDNGTAGIPYSQILAAAGDTPVAWAVETGSLPNGLILSGGTIAGTPTAEGTFNFSVKAQNRAGNSIKAFSIIITTAAYTITATADPGGSISPGGPVSVAAGLTQTFAIAPYAGYTVASVTVDNVSQGAVSAYTFTGVSADHAIHAAFIYTGEDAFTFGTRETEAASITISAEGLFKPDAVLNAVPLMDGESSREGIEALLSGKEVVAAFEISIAPDDAFIPPLTLRFQVGERYNGRTVYILHKLHNGSVEQFTVTIAGNEAVITVQELSPFVIMADPWITITAQPQNTTVVTGQTAVFTVLAEGAVPLAYQWQKKTVANAAWADIPGAVNPEHTTSQATLANSGYQYRVTVTDAMGNSITSDAATLTVTKTPDTGDHAQPVLYAALMILFLASAVVLLRRRKTE